MDWQQPVCQRRRRARFASFVPIRLAKPSVQADLRREELVIDACSTPSAGRDPWSCYEGAEHLAPVSDERFAVREKQVVEVELGEPPICLA